MFSLVIPTYRRNSELLNVLEMLNKQEFKSFEVVIVDDDPESNLVFDKEKYDFEIQYYVNEVNSGPAYSRNLGINKSKFEWIVFCDDDDEIFPSKLLFLKNAIEKKTDINFILHRGIINLLNENKEYYTKNRLPNFKDELFVFNCIGGTPFVSVKKELLELENFDENLKALEDYDLWIRIFRSGKVRAYLIEDYLVKCTYQTKKSSVSKNINNNKYAWIKLSRKYKSAIDELSFRHKLKRKSFFNSMIGYKYLLNYSRVAALYYLKAAFFGGDLKYIIVSMISLFSIRSTLKLR